MRSILAIVPALVVSAVTVTAQTAPVGDLRAVRPLLVVPRQGDRLPARPMLPPTLAPPPVLATPAVPAPKPRVVCGMQVLEANGALDPGIQMRRQPTSDTFTIRAIEPPICKSPR